MMSFLKAPIVMRRSSDRHSGMGPLYSCKKVVYIMSLSFGSLLILSNGNFYCLLWRFRCVNNFLSSLAVQVCQFPQRNPLRNLTRIRLENISQDVGRQEQISPRVLAWNCFSLTTISYLEPLLKSRECVEFLIDFKFDKCITQEHKTHRLHPFLIFSYIGYLGDS